jgi:hypothetical protein
VTDRVRESGQDPDDAWVDHVIETAIRRGERARRARIGAWSAATVALAGLALGLILRSEPDTRLRVVEAAQGSPKVIRLAYDSRTDRPDTRVSVSLSDNLDLVGYADSHDLTWTTRLKKGVNVLELPVVLTNASEGRLTVAFATDAGSKQIRVVVRPAVPTPHEARLTDERRAGIVS